MMLNIPTPTTATRNNLPATAASVARAISISVTAGGGGYANDAAGGSGSDSGDIFAGAGGATARFISYIRANPALGYVLEDWLVEHRRQLLRFFITTKNVALNHSNFVLSIPHSLLIKEEGNVTVANSPVIAGRVTHYQHCIVAKREILAMLLNFAVTADHAEFNLGSYNKHYHYHYYQHHHQPGEEQPTYNGEKLAPAPTPATKAGIGLEGEATVNPNRNRPLKEMKRFLIIYNHLTLGIVKPKSIQHSLVGELACSIRTIRHYRQRLLDGVLISILTQQKT